MWNFFKPRAAGVFGVTVYIIWKKNFMWGRLWGGGMFGTKRGMNIGYLSDDLVYKGL